MDITPVFDEALNGHHASLKSHPFRPDDLDHFVREAYRINAHVAELTAYLRSIRPSYLSAAQASRRHPRSAQRVNSSGPGASSLPSPSGSRPSQNHNSRDAASKPLTDAQRDRIDAETKAVLGELTAAIRRLGDAERVRADAANTIAARRRGGPGFGALGRWAAGGRAFRDVRTPEEREAEGKRDTLRICREGVLWFLQRRLERAGRAQSEMMEVRLKREVEKNKSVLHRVSGANAAVDAVMGNSGRRKSGMGVGASAGTAAAWATEEQEGFGGSNDTVQLSDEQLQLFEEENRDMLRHYENALDQVKVAERSLLEIAEQHNVLAANLATQSEHIDQLVQDSQLTTENVGSGNKELKRAAERRSWAQMVFYGTAAFCATLVLWDFVI